jgi:cell wall-associated NlpC family hydrolase
MIGSPSGSPKLPMAVWLDLLGKPFQDGGRGPDAFDCVGLLIELQRRLGRAMPPYESNEHELSMALASWDRVESPEPGDGILIRSDNPRWHIGVVCGGGYMIHAFQARGVSRERYDAFPWHNRIEGFYRWRQA